MAERQNSKISSGAIKDLQEENEDYIPHYKQGEQERGSLNGREIPGVGMNYIVTPSLIVSSDQVRYTLQRQVISCID